MARELHKSLIAYFSQLEKVDHKWKELAKAAERPLEALRNQAEQLRLVSSKEVNDAELCKVEELHERLIFKILMGIENEVVLLLDISTRFNSINQDLKNRLKNLEDARSRILLCDAEMKELVNGTPYRPRLNFLLESAVDGFKYYNELYLRVNGSIKGLDYKNDETIEAMSKSFVEDRFERAKIDRILAFTQFLIKETVR